MERFPHGNGYLPPSRKPPPLIKRLSLSNLLRSTSMGKLAVRKYPRGYMEPEVLPIGRHDVAPHTPPGTPDTNSPISPQPKTTASCSNLPSASPSLLDAHYGTLAEDKQLQNSWSEAEGLNRTGNSGGSSPLTAGRSTDGLLVSGDRESPYQSGQSTEAVHSSGEKEDYSSGHASMSSDDMSRTTSPHMQEATYSHSESSRSSSSHRSQTDSPSSHRHHAKQSQHSESFQRSNRQYAKESQPSESYHQKSNGSYTRERHPSGSSQSDDRLHKRECQPYDSSYHRDIYWQQKSGSPRSGSPRSGSPRSGSPRCGSPRTRSPRIGSPGSPRTSSPKTSPRSDSIEYQVQNQDGKHHDTMPTILANMSMGSAVVKVKGPGRCTVKTLYLDSNKTSIKWKPSKKGNKAKINIDVIKEVRDGESTDILKRLGQSSGHSNSQCCFSIVYGTAWESLDLIADDQEDAAMWISGLRYLMATSKRDQLRMRSLEHRDQWLRATFEAADKSGDGLLSIDEILKLLHKLNVSLSKRKVKQLFKEADSNTEDDNVGQLSYDEFIHFYKTISTREELDSIIREYGHGKGHLTLQELARFLSQEQHMEDVTMDHCVDIIRRYEPIPENSKNGWIGIDGFARYLLSKEGHMFNPDHHKVNQDMSQPLAHYYIASSHNTYLVGDQLMSQSSVDVYAMVLQAGCRCVEMDCWDGKDGEPVIYHGYTLTSRIKFRDVITVVNKYAFKASPYPVILSIENHCSLDQQKKMAQYLVDILGDKLEVPTLATVSSHLPSPEHLRGRILIKSKKINWDYLRQKMATDEDAKKLPLDHNDELEAGEVSEEDSADELDEDFKLEKRSMSQRFESMAMAQMALMKKKPIKPSQSAWKRIAAKAREQQQDGGTTQQPAGNNSKATSLTGTLRRLKLNKKKPKSQSSSESGESGEWDKLPGSEDYDSAGSRPGSFDKDAKPGSFDKDESKPDSPPSKSAQTSPRPGSAAAKGKGKRIVLSKQLSELVKLTRSVNFRGFINLPCWELPSLGEMRASNMVATKPMEFVAFTTRHMCRVYPSAYRIDSSNYNPQPMWNCGCQLVALNYQTEGRPMQVSQALFSGNGSCGYVLKPYPFRDDSKPFDPNAADPMPGSKKTQVTIHIISGQQLPKPPQSLLGERGEIIDPYVEVELTGLPIDCQKAQTKTIQDNGFNPYWDCNMTFTVHLADLALIRFAVWDEDPIGRDFIGQATLPVRSLMPGYRHVHLEGLDQASLFVHVTVEDYDTWATRITKVKPKGLYCRTKSVELEYSPITGGHRNSPRRRSSLAQMFRRKHSMPIAPSKEFGPPTASPSRMKRRSYDDANSHSIEEQFLPDDYMKHYQTITPVCLDSLLKKLLSSGVPTELEADGSTSIHVKYMQKIFAFSISPSSLLSAIREGTVSVWSEEGGYLLTGNYNWDLVEQCRGLNQFGFEGFEEEDEYEGEEVVIKPYSHSNSLENGLDITEIAQSKFNCGCDGGIHQEGCELFYQNSDFYSNNDSNDETVISPSVVHGSFPDIIKSTSISHNALQTPTSPSTDDDWTEESTEDASLISFNSSSSTLDLEDETECMLIDSDDVFMPNNEPLQCVAKGVQTNNSYLQTIPSSMSPSQSASEILQEPQMRSCGIIYDDTNIPTQSLNKNPLGKTESSSSTNSGPTQYSPKGSTMSISSSLCRDFDTVLSRLNDDNDLDATSLQSRQSSDRNSDAFTVNDIISMTLESKSGRNIEEAAAPLLNQLDVTLHDIFMDETSQSLDDAISDISGTEYESDTSDVDTLSTTSGEVSLCNGWETCESPNIEQMLGSLNRSDSFTEGSQDSVELPRANTFHSDNPYVLNGNNDVVHGMPYQISPIAMGVTTCSCTHASSGSQRRYRKKHESKMKCSCSRKNRMYLKQTSIGTCQKTDDIAIFNDNNNNGDLILINNVENTDIVGDVDARRSKTCASPAKVLRKVSQRLSSEEVDSSDNVSISSESSTSSASTVVEVNKNSPLDEKLALLQFDDVFAPDEYDTFKNDLMWRWYDSEDEPQISRQDAKKSPQTYSMHSVEGKTLSDTSDIVKSPALEFKQEQQTSKNKDAVDVNHKEEGTDEQLTSKWSSEPFEHSRIRQSSVLSNPDDDNVFLPDSEPNLKKKEPNGGTTSPIDDMIQKLCVIVNAENENEQRMGRKKPTAPLKRPHVRKEYPKHYYNTIGNDSRTEWPRSMNRTGARNVRFAEVDPSRVAIIKPVMKETGMQRSCLKKQKSSTIDPCVQSLTDINKYSDKFETPSIVERFYQRNFRGQHKDSLSHLSRSSPHLATSDCVPKYTDPPPYEGDRQQSSLRMKRTYERSQSVMNISQAGRIYEPVKRCDPAVLLYGTYRPPPRSPSKKNNVIQPPAPPLPRPPSYEQHLQKYGLPRFLQSSKHRHVEIPPSPIMAQFSTERNRCTAQSAVVRRRDRKGMKLEPGGKKRHSTGSYFGMSQEQMQNNLEDFSKDWKDESKPNGSVNSSKDGKQDSPQGHRSKLKNRMIYFLLNL